MYLLQAQYAGPRAQGMLDRAGPRVQGMLDRAGPRVQGVLDPIAFNTKMWECPPRFWTKQYLGVPWAQRILDPGKRQRGKHVFCRTVKND